MLGVSLLLGVSCPPDGPDGFAIGVLPPAPPPAAPPPPAPPPPPPCDRATVEPAASAKAATEISNVRFIGPLLEIFPVPFRRGRNATLVGRVPRSFQIVPICDVP